ncbi:armadillo-type protein [Catenaria anguillulae PL171]|uniref:Armadillo-type protein n=1 Tax=Catenaria anguillulae PL171 TaxID=765915 RepID=A0A1Y2HXH9_9FUNG|nr:armadillo-type protein [Catenaria anguillulae PL171]
MDSRPATQTGSTRELATGGGANRWRFMSFHDRIKHVKIDVTQSAIALRHEADVDAADADAAGMDSAFVASLAQWRELNGTAQFSAFAREVAPLAHSLAMVLYRKQQIVDAIVEHLAVDSANAYEPILSLTTSLAKDLRQEFFPYLGRVIAAILPILRLRDSSVIEHGFQCIAYLLRYLQRDVLRNMAQVYDMLSPLLGHATVQKPYIRQFAAESLSFMLRKLKRDQVPVLIAHIFASLDAESHHTASQYAEAIGYLIAETVCHVNHTLHSCHPIVLPAVVNATLADPSDRRDVAMAAALGRILSHLTPATSPPVFKVLVDRWSTDADRISRYLLVCVNVRQGDRVPSYVKLLDAFAASVVTQSSLTSGSMDLLAQLLLRATYQDTIKHVSTLENVTTHAGLELDVLLAFHMTLVDANFDAYNSLVLPMTVRFLSSKWSQMDQKLVLAFLAHVLTKVPLLHAAAAQCVNPHGKLIFDKAFPLVAVLESYEPGSTQSDLEVIAAVSVARKLAVPTTKLQPALESVLTKSITASTMVFAHTLQALMYLNLASTSPQVASLITSLDPLPTCPYLLDALCHYLTTQPLTALTPALRADWTRKLTPLAASLHHSIRLPALTTLAYLHADNPLLDLCAKAEATPNTLDTIRAKTMHVNNIALHVHAESPGVDIVVRCMVAQFATNFAPLWPAVSQCVRKLLDVAPAGTWAYIEEVLEAYQGRRRAAAAGIDLFALPETRAPMGGLDEAEVMLSAHAAHTFNVTLDRVDFWNVYALVIKAIAGHNVTETRSKFIVPYFCRFVDGEYRRFHKDVPQLGGAAPDDQQGADTNEEQEQARLRLRVLPVTPATVAKKLVAFLDLFSHFKPHHVHKADVLYSLYDALLVRGDADLQRAALKCMHTYAHDWYTPYHSLYLDLLDDAKFRDTLLGIKLEPGNAGSAAVDQVTFKPHHRADAARILTRVLYGRMMCRKGHVANRRINVLSLMSGATTDEIVYLFRLMWPMDGGFDTRVAGQVDVGIVHRINVARTAGFLTLMEDVMKQLGKRVACVVGPVADLLTGLAVGTVEEVRRRQESEMPVDAKVAGEQAEQSESSSDDAADEHQDTEANEGDTEVAKEEEEEDAITLKALFNLRTLCLRRLIAMFKLHLPYDYTPHVQALYTSLIQPQLAVMFHENKSSISASLNLLTVWAVHHFAMFQPIAPSVLGPMISCLVGFEPVRTLVLDSLFNVMEHDRDLLEPVADHLFETSAQLVTPKTVVPMSRLIKLCSDLAPMIRPALASRLVTVLLPVVTASKATFETKASILVILQSCIQHLPRDDVRAVLLSVSRLLADLSEKTSRVQLTQLVEALAAQLGLPLVGSLIAGLNAYHRRVVDQLDYDVVLTTFTRLAQVHGELQYLEWVPVLHNMFFLIKDDDLSARGNASHNLALFAQLAARTTPPSATATTGGEDYQGLVQHVVYPAFKKSIRASSLSELVRLEWSKVLLACVQHLGHMDAFADMVPLLPRDATDESGFFENIYHIQTHRRQRALVRLREYIPKIRAATLNHVFLPLMTHVLTHKDSNLVTEAVLTITAITKCLPWGSYYLTLRKFFNQLRAQPEKKREKLLMRAVVAILDGFHFEIADAPEQDPTAMDVVEEDGEAGASLAAATEGDDADAGGDDHDNDDDESADAQAVAEAAAAAASELAAMQQKYKIHKVVTVKVIPELHRYLMSRKDNDDVTMSVRVPIALGIASVITWLPEKTKNVEIPSLLTKLAQLLRARLQATRNVTRTTLIKIIQLLGTRYLYFMIKELRGALLRGYQMHVLGYTVHAILASIDLNPACLKACAYDLCAIVANDIFGEVGDEKDAEAYIKSMKELKTCVSYDTVELMATHGSVDVLSKMLVEVKKVLVHTRDAKVLDKAQKFLKRMTPGIVANQHVTLEQLMKLVHSLVVETYAIANAVDVDVNAINAAKTDTTTVHASATTQWKANAHYFVEFGLHLLQTCLRSPRLDIKNQVHMQMLNSMVDVVGQCFNAKHNNTYILASYAMQYLCKLPLSQLRSTLPLVMTKTFTTITSLPNARSDIAQASLKLVNAVMKSCDYVPFTQKQVKHLLRLLRPEIGDHDNHTITYSVLKSIFARRIVVNEVYEMILEIATIMVTSHSTNVQDLCRSVYLQFLLTYPQGKQRMDNHVSWMVKNLAYEFEQGRMAVLELLHGFIRKLPEDMLAEYGEIMFVGLVSGLTDDSPKCQEMSATVILGLLGKMSPQMVVPVLKMLRSWYKNPKTKAIAVQLHGLLIQAERDVPDLMPLLQAVFDDCERARRAAEEQDEDESMDAADGEDKDETAAAEQDQEGMDANANWKLLYLAVLTLTKLITRSPTQTSIAVVTVLHPHVTHPHVWIRLASARCLGLFFATGGDVAAAALDLKTTRSLVRDVARQLGSVYLDKGLATQVVKNLFYLSKRLHVLGSEIKALEATDAGSDDDNQDDDNNDDGEDSAAASKPAKKSPLLVTLQFLSFLARKDQAKNKSTLLRTSLFQVFAAIANFLDPESLVEVVQPIMAPIFRTMQDESVKGDEWDALRTFCQEIMDLLQAKLGQAAFTTAYAQVRSHAENKRQSRKQERAEMAVVDPQRAAQRKLARNLAKSKAKKRKAEEEMKTKLHTNVKRAKTKH